MMTDRSAKILEAAIREFITTGEAVSSGLLFRRYSFGIRPAMIRTELGVLTDAGYLDQPYHSAGRVPTDRGYEFFAERAFGDPREERSANTGFMNLFERGDFGGFLDALSGRLGIVGVAGDMASGRVYKQGLEDLVRHLAWGSREELVRVIEDFEAIDDRLGSAEDVFGRDEDILKVFIGRKSPFTKSDDLAVMVGNYDCCGREVFLLAMGPKRMDYEKAAGVFRGLKKSKKKSKKS